jgi:ribose transport system substrate-binding protein
MRSTRRSPIGAWRTALVVCAAAASLALGACGGDDESDTTAAGGGGGGQEVKKIAFFGFAKANSFAQATWAGIQEQAKKEGVEAEQFDPNFDSAKQVSQIQNAITSGDFQAFVVQANDGNAVMPPIREALDEKIAVVAEFTPVGTRYDTIEPQIEGLHFVGEAPTENGTALGKAGVAACEGVDPCEVAYLEGFKSLPLDNARTDAVKKELATDPSIKLVASVEGGYTQASGLKAAQNVLQANPDLDVMIGSSQAIAGAEQAVKDAGAKVKLIGNGGSRQAINAVRDGRWFATYASLEKSAGAKAAEIAIKAARGENAPPSFDTRKLLDNPLLTKDNVGDTQGEYDE